MVHFRIPAIDRSSWYSLTPENSVWLTVSSGLTGLLRALCQRLRAVSMTAVNTWLHVLLLSASELRRLNIHFRKIGVILCFDNYLSQKCVQKEEEHMKNSFKYQDVILREAARSSGLGGLSLQKRAWWEVVVVM